ncbi:TrkA family potassium uptake protein [Marinilabilia salmonicolor]|jgi:trk system potassium uptake protein TrkA|uniref:Trk system potassium uptake protein TrkA n=1 Tax=Marinilabilia salmonicolor TaxID=989 RepID=A0A368VBK2_9BACT|nr:TrkA family potassium uptake protein [Marinilabilia salmonicolor]RCW38637.1 trk system potassium uptake protein TrkA [Marinilabilia salmonicolor]
MAQKIAVIGMGQFGMAIAKSLTKKGAEVMAIDRSEHIIEEMSDRVALAVAMDATDKRTLLSQGILDFDAVVVAIGEDFEQLLLCTTLLMDIGVKRIMARARGKNQRVILEKIGVKEILSPEDEVGINVAERLINPSIVSYLDLPDEFCIMEVAAPPDVIGRSLIDIALRRRYHLNLITMKRSVEVERDGEMVREQHIYGIPRGESLIRENDSLVLFGKRVHVERFIEINK